MIEAGKTYRLRHQRKGNAIVRIESIGEPWIHVVIVQGTLRGIGAGALWVPGDNATVRDSLCEFTCLTAERPAPWIGDACITENA